VCVCVCVCVFRNGDNCQDIYIYNKLMLSSNYSLVIISINEDDNLPYKISRSLPKQSNPLSWRR